MGAEISCCTFTRDEETRQVGAPPRPAGPSGRLPLGANFLGNRGCPALSICTPGFFKQTRTCVRLVKNKNDAAIENSMCVWRG